MRKELLVLLFAVAGCTPDFDAIERVKDLRILGLRAEPPEVFLPSGATNVPPIRVDTLVVDPRDPGRKVSWEMWTCSHEKDYCLCPEKWPECPKPKWAPYLAASGTSSLAEISGRIALSAEQLAQARAGDPLKGFGGTPVLLELRVYGEFVERATTRLVYVTAPAPTRRPNQNPAIDGLITFDPAKTNLGRTLPGGNQAITVPAGAEFPLAPLSLRVFVGDGGTISMFDGHSYSDFELNQKNLYGVHVAAPTLAFAVGQDGTLLRFDGKVWSVETSPTTRDLRAIWGSSPANIFAVGDGGTILHYDGTSWQSVPTPTTQALRGVFGVADLGVIAVGDGGTAVASILGSPFAPLATGTSKHLRAVWGTGPTNIYLVGDGGTVLRFDGQTIRSEEVTASAGLAKDALAAVSLRGVWAKVPEKVLVVGDQGTALFSDGTRWKALTVPEDNGRVSDFRAIWGAGSNDVYAVATTAIYRLNEGSASLLAGDRARAVNAVSGFTHRESYEVPTFVGKTRRLEEFLTYQYFTTTGSLSNPRTGGRPSPFVDLKLTTRLDTTWTPTPEDRGSATIWVVVRDDRGGVNWTSLSAKIDPPIDGGVGGTQ